MARQAVSDSNSGSELDDDGGRKSQAGPSKALTRKQPTRPPPSKKVYHGTAPMRGRGRTGGASNRAILIQDSESAHSSDSDADVVVVAASATSSKASRRPPRTDKGKKASEKSEKEKESARKDVASKEKGKKKADPLSDTSDIDEVLPVIDAKAVRVRPSSKTVKKSSTGTIKKRSRDSSVEADADARSPKKSFVERLSQQRTPTFKSSFKGKVKSSGQTSIPLVDERFESESEDDAYESEDRPSAHKKRSKAHSTTSTTSSAMRSTAPSSKAKTKGAALANKENEGVLEIETSDAASSEAVITSGSSSKKRRRDGSSEQAPDSSREDKLKRAEDMQEAVVTASDDEPMSSAVEEAEGPTRSPQLRELSSQRRKKEKAAKRVVASPSPTPDLPPALTIRDTTQETEDRPDEQMSEAPATVTRAPPGGLVKTAPSTAGKSDVSSPFPAGTDSARPLFIDDSDGEGEETGAEELQTSQMANKVGDPSVPKPARPGKAKAASTEGEESDMADKETQSKLEPKPKQGQQKGKGKGKEQEKEKVYKKGKRRYIEDDYNEQRKGLGQSAKEKRRREERRRKRKEEEKARTASQKRYADSSDDDEDGDDSSSSSSSSGSERLTKRAKGKKVVASDSEDEVENIALDYNPVKKEKLRPKDLAKASRLDKLKLAREQKQKRDERRKRGIIDSDDDEAPKAQAKQESPSDEDDSSSDSDEVEYDMDGNVKGFIISDEELDDDERAKLDRMMPTELTRHGKLELAEHFKIFITYLVYLYFFPKDKHLRGNKEYQFSMEAVRKALDGVINSSVASSIWKEDFRAALDERPGYEEQNIPVQQGCEGCNKHDRMATYRATISGKRYDPDTFEDESDASDDDESDEGDYERAFDLGRFCAERAYIHTRLKHFMYWAAQEVFEECRARSRLPEKLDGDRDEKRARKDKEAAWILAQWKNQMSQPPLKLWSEMKALLDMARKKYTS